MKITSIKLFDNNGDCHDFLIDEEALLPRQARLTRFIEHEGRFYELFSPLGTESTLRYCEVSLSRLSDFLVTSLAIDTCG
jgi:hypothetical protein